MTITKREIVEAAFEELALGSAFGYDLTPEELQFALRKLESLAAVLLYSNGVSLGYILAVNPSAALLSDDSGLSIQYLRPYSLLLAVEIAPSKGKAVQVATSLAASQARSQLIATAGIPAVSLPSHLPVGSGNKTTPWGGQEYFTGSESGSSGTTTSDIVAAETARAMAAEAALGLRIDGLTTDQVPEAASPSNLYHTAARVRDVALTGLSVATNAAVTASDSILVAIGKLQAQISALASGALLGVANVFTKAQTSQLSDLGTVTGTVTIDATDSNTVRMVLGGNITLAAPSNPMSGQNLGLHLIQDATGSRLVTWDGAFKWAGGTAPTLTTTANGRDFVACTYDNVSAVWVCSLGVKGAA